MRSLSSSSVVRDGAGTRISFHTNSKYSRAGMPESSATF